MAVKMFTVGHSTRSWREFVLLVREFGIEAIADVRRYPSSRKFPHFNRGAMESELGKMGIEYFWFEALGGRRYEARRCAAETSANAGLRSAGFRNYADHMRTEEFNDAIAELLEIAAHEKTALLCAEKFYWRCHRRLLSDYLVSRGVDVVHIEDAGKSHAHKLTPCAVISDGGGVTYPPTQEVKK